MTSVVFSLFCIVFSVVYYLNVSFSGFITLVGEERELFFLLSNMRNYVVSILKSVLFPLVLRVGCVMLLVHSLDFHIIIF